MAEPKCSRLVCKWYGKKNPDVAICYTVTCPLGKSAASDKLPKT